ncbi:MAG: major facilitator superfamily 1 [Aeromicrobium sp.]|nr:major facilitator superfamily 1 [Aeromicrobium sp.]
MLALVRRYVDETPRRPGRFDVVGAAAATLGAVSVVYAFINAPDHGWDSIGTIGGFALAAVLAVLFVRTERVVAHRAGRGLSGDVAGRRTSHRCRRCGATIGG